MGFASVISVYFYLKRETFDINKFNQIIGFIIIGSSAIFVLLTAINEACQRKDIIFNYRDCCDSDTAIANSYCKLFSRNEVLVERNLTISNAGLWKSTEQLLPQNQKNYTNLWTVFMVIPKLHGAVLFHYLFVLIIINSSDSYVNWEFAGLIPVLIMVIGSIFGCVLFRFFNIARVYVLSSVLAVIALGISFALLKASFSSMNILLWIFLFAISTVISVPDLALMEISKLRFCEFALSMGHFVEIVTIATLQSVQREAFEWTKLDWANENYFLVIIVSSMVALIVSSAVYLLHMPNTHKKSLLQIQNELVKYKKYFVFDFDFDVNAPMSETTERPEENNKNILEVDNVSMNVYSDPTETLPDPPTNKVKNDFDYGRDIPKPRAIIPRVNVTKPMTTMS